jgi:hypothetical protein
MFDHLGLAVPKEQLDAVVTWYVAALAPLGYAKQVSFPSAVGLGPSPTDAHFWICASEHGKVGGVHLAFRAKDHDTVDKFHEESIKAGGKCNGKPGVRTMYHPNYYAAFVVDPVG